jgi:PAS domain S-box-containing protein
MASLGLGQSIQRRFVLTTVQITILCIAAGVLFLVMIVLGFSLWQQSQGEIFYAHYEPSITVRPITQLQRELLRLLVRLQADQASVDTKAVESHRTLVASRVNLQRAYVQIARVPAIIHLFNDVETRWTALQAPLTDWLATPHNDTLRRAVAQELAAIELLVNDMVIQHDMEIRRQLSNFLQTSRQFLVSLGWVALLFGVFSSLVVVSTARFIKERRQAEAALRQSAEQFRALTEGSIQGILIHRDFKPLFVNQAYAAMLGYASPADVLALASALVLVAPQEREWIMHYEQRRLQGEDSPTHYEYQGIRHGGLAMWLDNVVRVVDWEGSPAIQSTVVDITARKQAEVALQYQRDWLDVTLASIGDAVIATDTHGIITLINRVAEDLTGWPEREALGRHIDAVFHIRNEHTQQPADNPIDKVLRHGAIVGLANHTALVTRHGHALSIADSGAPIRGEDGTLHGVVLVFRDVSEQRRLENEVLRTQKVESVGVLAGGLAHDFNNLLTGIMGNISLARRFAAPQDRVVERLIEAENACQRATALTHQLLTFAKGGVPIRETVSMAELLTESATFAVRGSKVRVDFAIAEDLWPGNIDSGQISQVIHNVVLNAVQAMPEGGHIQIAAENSLIRAGEVPTLPEGRYVKLGIHDNGSGIPEEVLPNIFDPYFTTKDEGSGLGLATAYSIVRKHDGYITVASEVRSGTTFVIYLPASQQRPVHAPEDMPAAFQGSGRLLVMDDEAMIRQLLLVMLEQAGYAVDSASDGAEAVALYQRAQEEGQPFALVILDVTVPGGMGGVEAFAQLRALDPQVRALISSGYANDPVLANYAAHGFRGVLTKPYTDQELYAALQRVLES